MRRNDSSVLPFEKRKVAKVSYTESHKYEAKGAEYEAYYQNKAWQRFLWSREQDIILRILDKYFANRDVHLLDFACGTGRITEFLENRVPNQTDHANVSWLGRQPHERLAALRRDAFLTIIPSRYETFGNTALEAMTLGCPVVAARSGGLCEMVQDGRNGLHFRVGEPIDLARKIGILLDNPSLAARLGRQARLDCERRYDPSAIARQTMDFYHRVNERWMAAGD